MKYLSGWMDYIARNVLKIIFTIFLLAAFWVKGMYSFADMPYFEMPTVYDVGMFLIAAGLYGIIFWKRDFIQEHFSYLIGFVLFMIVAILFIYFVPLKPFSDMEHIYTAAIKFANREWGAILEDTYWSVFPGNIRLGVFWGILLLGLPKSLVTIKILNAFFAFGAIYITSRLCEEYGLKYYKVLYGCLILFSPLVLYVNHVYFDLPLLFLCVLSVYVYVKYDNIIFSGIALALAAYLRKSAKVYLAALVFVFLFEKVIVLRSEKKKLRYSLIKLVVCIGICLGISQIATNVVKDYYYGEDYKPYPSWNQIYIGLNEERLGMMDGDFSYNRTARDVIERVKEYGAVKTGKILAKKSFWLWTQGTYQAQRYAFGEDFHSEQEKFLYTTVLTKYLVKDDQILRKVLNAFMRVQYLILFLMMVITLWKSKDIGKLRIWYYILIATFLIMLLYELKSRYIFHCLPAMAILACQGMEIIEGLKKREQI